MPSSNAGARAAPTTNEVATRAHEIADESLEAALATIESTRDELDTIECKLLGAHLAITGGDGKFESVSHVYGASAGAILDAFTTFSRLAAQQRLPECG
jgi:hypothetical protein